MEKKGPSVLVRDMSSALSESLQSSHDNECHNVGLSNFSRGKSREQKVQVYLSETCRVIYLCMYLSSMEIFGLIMFGEAEGG